MPIQIVTCLSKKSLLCIQNADQYLRKFLQVLIVAGVGWGSLAWADNTPMTMPESATNSVLAVAQQPDVRSALAAVYESGSVQSLTPEQRSALSAYVNPLLAAVYSMTFADVGPQVKRVYLPDNTTDFSKPPVHPMQANWQGQWQHIRPLLVGLGVDGVPSIEALLGRLKEAEKIRSLSLAVAQVDKALLRLKPNSTVRTEQLMFRLNALYIVLEGQVARALPVDLNFAWRQGGQETAAPELDVGIGEEEVVQDSAVQVQQPKRKAKAKAKVKK